MALQSFQSEVLYRAALVRAAATANVGEPVSPVEPPTPALDSSVQSATQAVVTLTGQVATLADSIKSDTKFSHDLLFQMTGKLDDIFTASLGVK